jgi:predicted TIM-barrel fold metal-dependent hydrolase
MAPGRRAGIIQVTLHDIEASVREIQWAAGVDLTGGILLPGAPPGSGLPPLHDHEYYERLWAACEETGLPVNCHSGGAAPRPTESPEGHVLFMLELGWWDHRVLRQMIVGGILERHPRLQVVFTEAGMAWIPEELQTLEYLFDSVQSPEGSTDLSFGAQVVSGMSCRPTEYWRRQCHVGASFMHRSDLRFVDELGLETVMWGSDYPHVEASFPYSALAIASTFAGVPTDATERILGANAAALYDFDIEALRPVASTIGPRRAAVHDGISPVDIPKGAAKCPAFAGILSDSGYRRWADNRKTHSPLEASM